MRAATNSFLAMIVTGKVNGDFMLRFNFDGNKKKRKCVVKNLWLAKLVRKV